MGELMGELIQMNAHMVRVKGFEPMLAFGIVFGVLFLVLMIFAISEKGRAAAIVCGVLALAFAGLVVAALRLPMKKEIHACASGPVSLEQVASVYDIVEIDGKELVLRER